MKLINQVYEGSAHRKSLIDFEEPSFPYDDIVIFIHGFKGYKDWGAWNLVHTFFIEQGIAFCKFNMSHNGGTIHEPIDFPDLDAFSKNRYSYELNDVIHVLDWLENKVDLATKKVHLIGHSRGGGIAVLSTSDKRITSVTTWASIADIGRRFPTGEKLEEWRKEGVKLIFNSRTHQNMPQNFSLYQDWKDNEELLCIETAAKNCPVPVFHLHGDKDDSVSITESEELSSWTEGKLLIVNDANHTFGTYHPYKEDDLSTCLYEVCNLTTQFISKQ